MNDKYDDTKHLTRPQYDDLHPMSMSDRAAQFSPFVALVGSMMMQLPKQQGLQTAELN